jgi:hypothetical protein
MSKSGIMWTWIGILAFVAVALGALEHASETNPNFVVDSAQVALRGVVIPPFRN